MLKNLGCFQDKTDHSLKNVFEKEKNQIIEMTLLFNKEEMDVVCAPTHHFCNLGCKMCHLTNNKLNKKMIPIQIDDFLEGLIETVTKSASQNQKRRITNKKKLLISFMGVGEPLLNLELIAKVHEHEQEIKDKLSYENISYAISTMMPNNNVKKLTSLVTENNIPLKLHFSLHTPLDKDRKELIPSTNVSIEEALQYMLDYRNSVTKNKKIMDIYQQFHRTTDPVEIHYTLISKVNDTKEELEALCKLLKKYSIPIKFIRFNPINKLERSEKEELWMETLQKEIPGLRIKTYSPPGRDVGSSCGEFTKHYYHEEIETPEEKEEFEQWQKTYGIDKAKL